MQVLTIVLLSSVLCFLMMNWQRCCHNQQRKYTAMSHDNVHTSPTGRYIEGHHQGTVLPSSSPLIDPTSNLLKDILGNEDTSYANSHAGGFLIGGEKFICISLNTDDPRFKRITFGLKWILRKIFMRKDISVCPLTYWIIYHNIVDVKDFERILHASTIDPTYEWKVKKDDSEGKEQMFRFQLSPIDMHELLLFRAYDQFRFEDSGQHLTSNVQKQITPTAYESWVRRFGSFVPNATDVFRIKDHPNNQYIVPSTPAPSLYNLQYHHHIQLILVDLHSKIGPTVLSSLSH